jgi:hypothetical protein
MARDIAEVVVPGAVVALIFFIIFGFATLMRYFRYKETVALAEKGLLRESRQHKNRNTLRTGVIVTAIGLALSCGLMPIGFLITDSDVSGRLPLGFFGPWMVVGLLPVFFGLALIIIHTLNGSEEVISQPAGDDEEQPIPPHKRS